MKLGWKRLLKLADILDVADAEHRAKGEPRYRQTYFSHECGAPACALGHWAAANRRRGWKFDASLHPQPLLRGVVAACWSSVVAEEFSISSEDGSELFSAWGCGSARTAKQAAKYLRKFVKRKQAEAP